MADEKLNTGPGEEKLPEAPAPVTADGLQAPAPEQAAAPTPQQEEPAQPEPGDVVEYSIWNDVFKQSVPNATFKIRMCTVIPTRKVTMKSVNAAKILVIANRVRPCLVVRRILSPPVWYSPAKVGAAIATHRIARNKI